VQHPADDSVWWFGHRDATGIIDTVRFLETTAGLIVDFVSESFIINYPGSSASYPPAPYGPYGEWYGIEAIPDRTRNVILLVFNNYQMSYYYRNGYTPTRTNNLSIVLIGADKSRSYFLYNEWVPYLTDAGVSVTSDGRIWIDANLPQKVTLDATWSFIKFWDGQNWSLRYSPPLRTGELPHVASPSKALFIAVGVDDHRLHMFSNPLFGGTARTCSSGKWTDTGQPC
jgi:hypothetical protein